MKKTRPGAFGRDFDHAGDAVIARAGPASESLHDSGRSRDRDRTEGSGLASGHSPLLWRPVSIKL